MDEIKHFVKVRNEAMFSLDRNKIEDYFAWIGQPLPENDIIFWATVHKCICNITTAPSDLVANSKKWLYEHGMNPLIII